MKKRTLAVQFAVIFIIFGIISICTFVAIAYRNEYGVHRDLHLLELKNINAYMRHQILADSNDFYRFAKYLKEYGDQMHISMNDINSQDEYNRFLEIFSADYPGKNFGTDITIDDLEGDALIKYLEYDTVYWWNMFQAVKDEFKLTYFYMIVPNDDSSVSYIVDVWKSPKEDNPDEMVVYFSDSPEENDPEEVPIMWNTWKLGEELDEFQKWDNENGRTYSYYTPVIINGEKMGLIVSEIDISAVNSAAAWNAILLGAVVALVYLLCGVGMFLIIKRRYVNNITKLNNAVHEFSVTKDYQIADRLNPASCTSIEMESLTAQVAEMIRELKKYLDEYSEAQSLYTDSKAREVVVNQLAMKDSLTGSYNKTAYDSMCGNIDNLINSGNTEFGIAMIDLNYLKKINDTYGHSKGNAALINLYELVCDIYPAENVYRIGGDEFVAVLVGNSFDNAEKDEEAFRRRIDALSKDESLKPWRRTSAAVGFARFDPAVDKSISDTFKRADAIMYENKKAMKAVRED
ncbi:MAG: diguanylate cyclase [Lachnospiraceae bacterium]|nr:diguanylate cyclase [Lachnospiraceae bacterium]